VTPAGAGFGEQGRRHTRDAGQLLLLYLFLLAFALLIAALRFWRLGDLSLTRKFLESSGWFVGVVLMGGSLLHLLQISLQPGSARSAYPAARMRPGSQAPVSAEDLSVLESEIPEVESPEISGLQGKPPEELAEALRSLSSK
jgi:hypothetical protein